MDPKPETLRDQLFEQDAALDRKFVIRDEDDREPRAIRFDRQSSRTHPSNPKRRK